MLPAGKDKAMEYDNLTKSESIDELVKILKKYNMNDKANNVYETAVYVDMLEKNMAIMANELVKMRRELQEIKDKTFVDTIKTSLSKMIIKTGELLDELKITLFVIKENMKDTAKSIVNEFKTKGKSALNRVYEFIGLKDKLESMRNNIKQGIIDTERTINKLERFGADVREAKQNVNNAFRTFFDKPIVDYTEKTRKFTKTDVLKKPWEWQKNVYNSMVLHLDAAIDKVHNLAMDVQMKDMEKMWDNLYNTPFSDEDYKSNVMSAVAEPNDRYETNVKNKNREKSR